MRPNRLTDFARDCAVTGLGENRDGLGEVRRNTCRNRNQTLSVFRVYVAHI
jgi:hypothetical protein